MEIVVATLIGAAVGAMLGYVRGHAAGEKWERELTRIESGVKSAAPAPIPPKPELALVQPLNRKRKPAPKAKRRTSK